MPFHPGRALAMALAATLAASPATAQTLNAAPAAETPWLDQREAREQTRIDAGVRDGSLTTTEAQRLQDRQQRLTDAEARAKADGVVGPTERARLNRQADRQSGAIRRERHDGAGTVADTGPTAPGVHQRDRNEQARIQAGRRDGSLTGGEYARLERGERRIHGAELRARADGVVTPAERGHVRHMQNHQSAAIHRARHNGRDR